MTVWNRTGSFTGLADKVCYRRKLAVLNDDKQKDGRCYYCGWPDHHNECDDADAYGHYRPTPEVIARANAEWLAMDERGRLPEGWTYEPDKDGGSHG